MGVVPPTLITSSPPASAVPSVSGSSAAESSHASSSSGMSNAFLANALRILGHQGEKPARDKAPPEPPPDAPAATGLAVPSAGNYNVPALPGSSSIIANSKVFAARRTRILVYSKLLRASASQIRTHRLLVVVQSAHVLHASFV